MSEIHAEEPRKRTRDAVFRATLPWALTIVLGLVLVLVGSAVFDVSTGRMWHELVRVGRLAIHPHAETQAMGDVHEIVWKSPRALS